MFIVHVTPIVKGRSPDRLSYFSTKDLPVGSIVDVPLQKREVPALILQIENAQTIKSLLRTSRYATRKIRPQKPRFLLTPSFVDAASETADYYATSVGSVIESFVPSALLNDAPNVKASSTQGKTAGAFEKQVLQLPKKERIDAYKTLVRSRFSKKQSVYLCVSSTIEAYALQKSLKKGIEKYIFVFDSSQSKRKQIVQWKAALEEEHPVLIIATAGFSSIPRTDINLFIVERELAGLFKQVRKPFIDARFLIEKVAKHMSAQLVVTDTFVRITTHYELTQHDAQELEERARRIRTQSKVECVDMGHVRKNWKETKTVEPYPVLSPQSIKLLKKGARKEGHTFVFAARRGIAPHSVCNDCSKQVLCNHCKAPVVLHDNDTKRVLLCHRCGASRDAHETCAHCGSWNLVSLGIGIEKVEEYIREHVPGLEIIRVDVDVTKKPKDAEKAITRFFGATKGAVLLGTGMALPYLQQHVDDCIVSTLDSLMAVPDFRIEEKLFGLLVTLREQTTNTMIIETSNPKSSMLKAVITGNVARYTREELALRAQLKYPPHTVLIKVTREGARETVIKDMQKFVAVTEKYKPRVFSTFVKSSRSRPVRDKSLSATAGSKDRASNGASFALAALFRVPKDKWPHDDLLNILRALPPTFAVDVEPERAL